MGRALKMHENLNAAVEMIVECFKNGGKLLICGNGGSGADSAHILGELVKGFMLRRPLNRDLIDRIGEPWAEKLQRGLPAIDLTANCALIGAVANDQDGLLPYAQQVMAYCRPNDVLIGISTSGNSENVRRAMVTAKALGGKCIALTGMTGGKLRDVADLLLNVDETETYRVQEKHLQLYHQICMRVESAMFGE